MNIHSNIEHPRHRDYRPVGLMVTGAITSYEEEYHHYGRVQGLNQVETCTVGWTVKILPRASAYTSSLVLGPTTRDQRIEGIVAVVWSPARRRRETERPRLESCGQSRAVYQIVVGVGISGDVTALYIRHSFGGDEALEESTPSETHL